MTGSSNDLPGSLKTSTRSVITTGPIGCDVDDTEVETLDAWRARADERGEVVGDGLPALDRRQRDVVVDGGVGEECHQGVGSHALGPRYAEPAHHLDWALHIAPPAVELRRRAAMQSSFNPLVALLDSDSCHGGTRQRDWGGMAASRVWCGPDSRSCPDRAGAPRRSSHRAVHALRRPSRGRLLAHLPPLRRPQ